jgi:hypothetical protein
MDKDYAVVKIDPKEDELDGVTYLPLEATLTLSIGRKRYYDCFVDVSLNRISDPANPKFVLFLRGDGEKVPIFQIQSRKNSGSYITQAEMNPLDRIWRFGDNAGISPEGGWMEKFSHNITTPAKGQVVRASTAANDTVSLSSIDGIDPFGVVYNGIADSDGRIWVVTGGKAEVLYVGPTTRRHFARTCVAADTGAAAGYAISEAVPTSPFATDKHFMEIGHLLQTRADAGLALTALHFN